MQLATAGGESRDPPQRPGEGLESLCGGIETRGGGAKLRPARGSLEVGDEWLKKLARELLEVRARFQWVGGFRSVWGSHLRECNHDKAGFTP